MSGNDSNEEHRHASFEESAKKFRPGPVAPSESEEDRRDMGGAEPPRAAGVKRRAEQMPEGEPGVFKKMPGED